MSAAEDLLHARIRELEADLSAARAAILAEFGHPIPWLSPTQSRIVNVIRASGYASTERIFSIVFAGVAGGRGIENIRIQILLARRRLHPHGVVIQAQIGGYWMTREMLDRLDELCATGRTSLTGTIEPPERVKKHRPPMPAVEDVFSVREDVFEVASFDGGEKVATKLRAPAAVLKDDMPRPPKRLGARIDTTASICGDPAPHRSALAMRRAAEAAGDITGVEISQTGTRRERGLSGRPSNWGDS